MDELAIFFSSTFLPILMILCCASIIIVIILSIVAYYIKTTAQSVKKLKFLKHEKKIVSFIIAFNIVFGVSALIITYLIKDISLPKDETVLDSKTGDIVYDSSRAEEFLQGKWYALNDSAENAEFIMLDFDASEIRHANYVCSIVEKDDMSGDNIYYRDKIYHINTGSPVFGSFTVTQSDALVFKVEATFPADEQNPESIERTYEIRISPENNDRFEMILIDSDTVNLTFVRGDIEELRKYA